ncbi:MAG: serine/threonine-protein kinase [Pirellulaceae bacterium]
MLADAVGVEVSTSLAGSALTRSYQANQVILALPFEFGDYTLLREVGRGGMGVVYEARQKSLDRTVAVKMLLRGQWASASDQARFRAEAESAASLHHPQIVPVYEVGERDGYLFFSMKFVSHRTLSQLLSDGPISPRHAAELLSQVARAIDFAHRHGVLHRDLKPSNILIDEEGLPHVSDFGLAKQVADPANLTRSGAVLGTPAYMAPEQAAGNRGEVGITSDVYSLGCILYHMLAGRPPFTAASPVDVVLMVLEQDPPLLRSLNPKADRDLEMIALRCLQKPQDLRYPSAAALANDLDAYLSDEPISARSGRFTQIVARLFRETHHAQVLENWGVLWMWHSLALLVVCSLTNTIYLAGIRDRLPYFLFWTAGLGTWAAVFWMLRNRMGPVTFVERQIAHLWAGSMISVALLFPVEALLDLEVLTLSPILALSSGMVFMAKAGILSGSFYFSAAALFATSVVMACWPSYAHFIFGTVSAACFFLPGWKYHQQKMATTPKAETCK